MAQVQTWRELLGTLIRFPDEKQRLAVELGVNPITLKRWVTGQSNPRKENIVQLLQAAPEHAEQFRLLLADEFKEATFTTAEQAEEQKGEIPVSIYTQIFMANAISSPYQKAWVVCDLLLSSLQRQLGDLQSGVIIMLLRCTPPVPGREVRTLYGSLVRVTSYSWGKVLERTPAYLVGAESLSGYAVLTNRALSLSAIDAGLLPALPVKGGSSALACPIRQTGKIAGCLYVCSMQSLSDDLLETKRVLIEAYANALALSFEPHEFYAQQQIALHVMPSQDVQQNYFSNFRRRTELLLRSSVQNEQMLTVLQAEQIVRQQIEEELVQQTTSSLVS